MTILCISDINWEIPDSNTLDIIKNEVENTSPSLVLFGGDVINDGWNEQEHVSEFTELLNYLEESETPSFTIQGNHDEYSNYDEVIEHIEGLEYAKEISERVVEFEGLKILGLPYSYTHQLRKAREISDEFPEQYDIVLAHAERSRRIWLFDLEAPIIITGHFANMLCQIQDQAFISMGAYPRDSVLIEPVNEIVYRRRSDTVRARQEMYESKVRWESRELVWEFDEYDPEVHLKRMREMPEFAELIERLIGAKQRIERSESEGVEEKEIIKELVDAGVPKTHIREYIGRYDFL
jgi:DNA repair exonuclease SbcCD nuclease subunit